MFQSVHFSSSVLSDSLRPQDCNTPGFPIHHQLLELAQTHVHWVGDAIQPSHRPSSPLHLPSIFPRIRVFSSESVLSIRQPKCSASSSVLPVNIQDWFPLGLTGLISLQSKGLSRVFFQHHSSKASILRYSALWSNFHIHTWLLEKT